MAITGQEKTEKYLLFKNQRMNLTSLFGHSIHPTNASKEMFEKRLKGDCESVFFRLQDFHS